MLTGTKPNRQGIPDSQELLDLIADGPARELIVEMVAEQKMAFGAQEVRQPPKQLPVLLVVEDDLLIRESLEMLLQDLGYRTLSASDMDEARSCLRSPHHIDGLIADIYLKAAIIGGCTLAREAVQLRPNLRVLYTTGTYVTEKMKGLFVEGSRCLRKPYTQWELRAAIEKLLAA